MKINDIEKWREEIHQAEKFREDEFGECTKDNKSKAGENIEYYESGYYERLASNEIDGVATLNIIDALTSIIVPSLYFRNPKTIVVPKKQVHERSAPLVAKTIDHFRNEIEAEETNQRIIWDAYVLGMGVYKVGYVTKFGLDIPDESKERKPKSIVDRGLEAVGLKKKEKEETTMPEMDVRILSESPSLQYISPFDFLIDPRATSINDAQWLAHRVTKTIKELKSNKKYKNTSGLRGMEPNQRTLDFTKISQSEIEDFHTRDVYEIHYRSDNKFYLLVISTQDSEHYEEHYHEESIYDMKEWQFDVLTFKKHGHSLYPRSDISKIKPLQDRITSTIDSILEQVDKFVPKLAYQEADVTEDGLNALKFGGIGALVSTTTNPNEVFKELNFTQLKADLQALIDQMISLISIQTGLTRAQLTGVSQSGTATEASIEQGGQTIRLSDMSNSTARFINKQSRKFWKVIKQFVQLDELELINGVEGVDETGLPKYDWLTISPDEMEKMQEGDYDFQIEVGSSERMNLAVVRKAFENWFNILARTDVIALMQQQGSKVDVAEFLKKGLDAFPELGIDSGKIIQSITPQTQGLLPPDVLNPQQGGTTQGSNTNELRAQQAQPALNPSDILQEASQL